jgi:predicted Zn-dependent protease
MRSPKFSAPTLLLLALLLMQPLVLLAQSSPQLPDPGTTGMNKQQQQQLGLQAAGEVYKQMPVLPDSSPETRYIQELGRKLQTVIPADKSWPYQFHVIPAADINAFALPGGPIFVNLGTIQAADNEAELAGVMAHEISHVVQRHGTRAASKQMAAQLPLAILGGVMGQGALSQMAQMGLSFGVGSYFLKNSRKAESEADLLGTDIMYDTGFNPRAMAEFFSKIQEQGGARGPQFFSDHPDPGNRAQAVAREVGTLPRKSNYRSDSAGFREIKQRVAGMNPLTAQQIAARQTPAMNASSGAQSGSSVQPSGSLRSFSHRDFAISYPENWQVYGDQNSAVTIAPASGVSQNAVAYGVMINTYQPEDANVSLDQATHDLLASLRWGAELPLTREQRAQVKDLCFRIAGLSVANIPSYRLKEEAEAKREAVREARTA